MSFREPKIDYYKLPADAKMLARLQQAAEIVAFTGATVVSPGDEPAYLLENPDTAKKKEGKSLRGEPNTRLIQDASAKVNVRRLESKNRSAKKVSKQCVFDEGDYVVYPAHGVGQIISIETQEIAGIDLELFVISFEKDKMTLRVPTSKAVEVGMRSLASPDIVSKAMTTLRGKAKVKRAMWSRRALEYEQKINSGDLIAIAEVVRDLHRTDDEREQSYSERQLYEAALERLTREVAAVASTDEASITLDVENALKVRVA